MNLPILYTVLSISFLIGIIMLYIKGRKSRNNNGNYNNNIITNFNSQLGWERLASSP